MRDEPLVAFDVDDPTILTRWMPRVPRRIRKAQHQRAYHLTNATTIRERRRRAYRENREAEIARCKDYYEANKGRLRAAALARYHAMPEAERRAKARAKYLKNRAAYLQRERERYNARKLLADVVRRLP